jgi:hypothetical protein|tara:strand:- start:327 stop:533 length:207 start_codon:yes stop_codon:yes gene_type:complete
MIEKIEGENRELVAVDYFNLNAVLIKMVRNGQLSKIEREELLQKAGLVKLENGNWKQDTQNVLTIKNK